MAASAFFTKTRRLMEEEISHSSTPDCVEAVLPQPEQESRTSPDQQSSNGANEVMVWGETEVQMRSTEEPNVFSFSPKADNMSEEAEECEETTWSPHPCTSPPISVATVQWDVHNSCTETPLLMTDSSLANELDFRSLIRTSPLFHRLQEADIELLVQGDKEEQDDTELLSSTVARSGNDSQVCEDYKRRV